MYATMTITVGNGIKVVHEHQDFGNAAEEVRMFDPPVTIGPDANIIGYSIKPFIVQRCGRDIKPFALHTPPPDKAMLTPKQQQAMRKDGPTAPAPIPVPHGPTPPDNGKCDEPEMPTPEGPYEGMGDGGDTTAHEMRNFAADLEILARQIPDGFPPRADNALWDIINVALRPK